MITPIDLTEQERQYLLRVAANAIRFQLARSAGGSRSVVCVFDEKTASLAARAGVFVTLERDDRLLGCIGSLEPTDSLVMAVHRHAIAAAFADPRLPDVTYDDFVEMSIKVSVLSELEPVDASSRDELAGALRPGVDGVLVTAGRRRATLLPAVWEKVHDVDEFLDALWAKAALAPGSWPDGVSVQRYETDEFADYGPRAAVVRER